MRTGLFWLLRGVELIVSLPGFVVGWCANRVRKPGLRWAYSPRDENAANGPQLVRAVKPGEMKIGMVRDWDHYQYQYKFNDGESAASRMFFEALVGVIPTICRWVNRQVPGCPETVEVSVKTTVRRQYCRNSRRRRSA